MSNSISASILVPSVEESQFGFHQKSDGGFNLVPESMELKVNSANLEIAAVEELKDACCRDFGEADFRFREGCLLVWCRVIPVSTKDLKNKVDRFRDLVNSYIGLKPNISEKAIPSHPSSLPRGPRSKRMGVIRR